MRTLVDELPDFFLRFAPELTSIRWPREVLSTCQDCAMRKERPGHRTFTASARCCTYQPRLSNFLAGRALRAGDEGSRRVAAEIGRGGGVLPEALSSSPELMRAYAERAKDEFGRNDELTCPYWVEGPLGCSIHESRNAICRTWHCKFVGGTRGLRAWDALKALLRFIEDALADSCKALGGGPDPDASSEAWTTWYLRCAEHVDQLGAADIAAMRTEAFHHLLARVRAQVERRDADLPDVVIPSVEGWVKLPDQFVMSAGSAIDMADMPTWIFILLSKLDGERTWWDARAAAEEETGCRISDDFMLVLWRRGLVQPPVDITNMIVNPDFEAIFAEPT